MSYNFEPGFEPLCYEILKFTPEEMAFQEQKWLENSEKNHPSMFDGLPELLKEYRAAGGRICVISHSGEAVIAEDYRRCCGFEPDLIYGWERGEGRRKPALWPLQQVLKETGLAPKELLMVDDMKPGWIMAKGCGVPFAFAGWGNPARIAHEFMAEHADFCLSRPGQLAKLLGL